jgi:hypothetical protein
MRIIIEAVTGNYGEAAVQRIRRQVFEREMGLKLPELGTWDSDRVLHLLARTEEDGDPFATLSIVDTSGDQDLTDKYGLDFATGKLTARYTQLAVLKAYRGMSIPLMMIMEGHRRFVAPRQIDYTWLLFDAGRAAESSMCRLLSFVPSERVLESEYGSSRALVRHEMTPRSIAANREVEEFLDQFVTSSITSPPEGSLADFLKHGRNGNAGYP